jgi:hypothetical protein
LPEKRIIEGDIAPPWLRDMLEEGRFTDLPRPRDQKHGEGIRYGSDIRLASPLDIHFWHLLHSRLK